MSIGNEIVLVKPPRAIRDSSMRKDGFSSFIGGAFGYVRRHHIKIASVQVELDTGSTLHYVRVPSSQWVADDGEVSTGRRDLPPIGSRVFVLFPYGIDNPEGAMVLLSVFEGKNKKHAAFLKEGDEKKVRTVREKGMIDTYDRETGDYTLEDADDANFVVSVKKSDKTIQIKDWNGNDILLSSDGVAINGNSKEFVTWAELNAALSTFLSQLTVAMTTTPIIGSGSPQATWTGLPTSINIDAAKTATVKTGG